MYAKYARTARKTLQKMLTIKEITSIIMHHLPSIQIEDCGSVDLTAYRFRYALEIQYTTLCKKCQTIVFSIKAAAFLGKKALDKCGVLTYNKDRKSIPVDGLLPICDYLK